MVLRLWTTQLKNHASILGNDERLFSSPKCPDLARAQPNSYSMGTRSFLHWGVKQLGSETDDSPPAYTFITNTVTTLLHFSNIRPCTTTLL
jgi:hypothetical protein